MRPALVGRLPCPSESEPTRRSVEPDTDCPTLSSALLSSLQVALSARGRGKLGLAGVREFGLDVIALVGQWRFREHRSGPEMHRALLSHGVSITERTVTHLMQRYEELVTLPITDQERIKARLQ